MRSSTSTIALLAAATLVVVAGCSSNSNSAPDPMGPPANEAPVVGAIANITTSQDTVVGPLGFSVNDDGTAADMLVVSATLDGATPFPADAVVIGGSGTTRSITLSPLESTTGKANVTIAVTDAQGLTTRRAFAITVNARDASVRDAVTNTFAKGEVDAATTLNGYTFQQDADDPATFTSLLGDE